MPSYELMVAAALVGALTFYLLFGGADFGAGIWTLFAMGRHGQPQRALIDQAIGPIWEANHVWLIIAVVILFTAFPPAFAVISTRLHIPLTVMLIGIVLRGTAFAIRTHDISSRPDGFTGAPAIGTEYLPGPACSRRPCWASSLERSHRAARPVRPIRSEKPSSILGWRRFPSRSAFSRRR